MESFSALLALCAGNSPVTGEFPSQRPVTRSFDGFIDLRLNKRLSKQSWGWWYETTPCSSYRHCQTRLVCHQCCLTCCNCTNQETVRSNLQVCRLWCFTSVNCSMPTRVQRTLSITKGPVQPLQHEIKTGSPYIDLWHWYVLTFCRNVIKPLQQHQWPLLLILIPAWIRNYIPL